MAPAIFQNSGGGGGLGGCRIQGPGPAAPPPRGRSPLLSHSVPQVCIGREGTAEAAPEAVRQAVGGGCQSGWGRLLSVTNAIEPGTWRQGDSGYKLGALERPAHDASGTMSALGGVPRPMAA